MYLKQMSSILEFLVKDVLVEKLLISISILSGHFFTAFAAKCTTPQEDTATGKWTLLVVADSLQNRKSWEAPLCEFAEYILAN